MRDKIINGSCFGYFQNMARIYFIWPCSKLILLSIRMRVMVILMTIGLLMMFLMATTFSVSRMWSSSGTEDNSRYTNPARRLHYGIVIDCGSSGSRVYVYFWPPHSGNPGELLNIQQLKDKNDNLVMKKVTPGISELDERPHDASEHIRPLLDFASQYIPKDQHKETSLYILATAGMRMISKHAQQAILDDLLKDIPKLYDFPVVDNHFEVISGKLEGVYAWIAVNYVLDKFSHGASDHSLVSVKLPGTDGKTHIRRRTVGMIDMGGGSVQIAFEVLNEQPDLSKHLLAEINLGCEDSDLKHNYLVYVTTFLGYGANSARERYEELLVKNAYKTQDIASLSNNVTRPITDPCLPLNMPLKSKDEQDRPHFFIGSGDFNTCKQSLTGLLNLSVPCQRMPCSMNGVSQPDIDFSRSSFYGFSEFWYSMEDVFRQGGRYDHDKFERSAQTFCKTDWSTLQKWYGQKLYPKADEARFIYQCFKSAWMTMVFHKGFNFPESYQHLQSAQLINNKDIQWTLGALIYRTKYIPLRDIEKHLTVTHTEGTLHPWFSVFFNEYLILVCFVIVIAAIVLYVRHLRLCPRSQDLPTVPSMSCLLIDEDQMEQGIRTTGYTYSGRLT
ncbi:ectonucleoside triphosphate diphosphohydrolase 7-like [Gigantopelta aegis]|uniref:ectonucleoside triphosphate diphosphohydrolase 7-like n=1 Tax=Gigantopelta aegis TaxID=1735272 RepID=UPI001B88D98B|nr:ectonucleoside triphosphate diphosphohydrolase 7-like [Gigantopelta aegis]